MQIPYPTKYKFDRQQFRLLHIKLSMLLNDCYHYGVDSVVEKLIFSILIETSKKFYFSELNKPQKNYTKELKYHEAFALLSFINWLLQCTTDVYDRVLLDQVRIMLDKKVN